MSTLPVKRTKDYSQFKSILGNRAVTPGHVNRMMRAIKQKNLLPYQPIMVNKELYVIDGQHRLAAAKRLKIEIPYVVVPDTDLEDVRLLNSHLKSWTATDFAESYAKTGNKHYRELLAFAKKHELPLSIAAGILRGNIETGGGKSTAQLRDGTFEVGDMAQAERFVEKITELRPFTAKDVWRGRHFLRALQSFYGKGAKHEELVSKLQEHGKRIEKQADYREYFFALSDIYNFHRKKEHLAVI